MELKIHFPSAFSGFPVTWMTAWFFIWLSLYGLHCETAR